ncbi:cell division topological specificity factor MinE [Flexilinea flocculi]|jgi:cell division topological specificity factor|uniref:Cell division topological specificity factor n=1 Tax=Flexilinea flocculi TaxID=1678840 RepID=A0A0S7BM94_9CHLR|nr:cell division topological specificity factor MinE [Flexilinea flocculi]NMB93212.1 cell division topological specificity factor MinE [Flexilinea flocculi]GAP41557.1 cell division topological specificity factor MinE [Flexilinea flocculi]
MGFWNKENQSRSSTTAKERLKFVLVHDRTDLSLEKLDQIKNEILEVISRHIDIDPESVVIDIQHDGREQKLIADIPIKNPRRK